MEHRYTDRKPMVLDVVIVCPRLGLVRGRTVNVGVGGMFVETGRVLMPINAPITVCFQPDPEQPEVNHQAQGMIVHQKSQGFGFMFDELTPDIRSVIDVLLAKPPTGRSGVELYSGAAATA